MCACCLGRSWKSVKVGILGDGISVKTGRTRRDSFRVLSTGRLLTLPQGSQFTVLARTKTLTRYSLDNQIVTSMSWDLSLSCQRHRDWDCAKLLSSIVLSAESSHSVLNFSSEVKLNLRPSNDLPVLRFGEGQAIYKESAKVRNHSSLWSLCNLPRSCCIPSWQSVYVIKTIGLWAWKRWDKILMGKTSTDPRDT